MLTAKIKTLSRSIHAETVAHRRHLHAYPELSFQEHNTQTYIATQLRAMNIPFEKMGGTGLLAIIKGHKPSDKVYALRADIDALPITEANEVPYKSTNQGVMHACGHDAHTASLLGTAKILSSMLADFGGTLKLLFQPGEERMPGGANLMIKDGALDSPKPTGIIGQHVMPFIPTGKVAIRSGVMMASSDELYFKVKGRGGHGGMPSLNIDPVLIAAQITIALQQVVSRMANPLVPSVLSIGRVIADGSTNVIPDEVTMEGTLRTMNEAWRTDALKRILKMTESIAEGMGGSCELKIVKGYPSLYNDDRLTASVRTAAEAFLGKENVLDIDPLTGSEDFAFYTTRTPGCFYFLGTGNVEKGISSMVHTPTFDIDEQALEHSTGLMAYLALKELGN